MRELDSVDALNSNTRSAGFPFQVVDLLRLTIALALLLCGFFPILSGLSTPWLYTLRFTGGIILFHWVVEKTLPFVRDKTSLKGKEDEIDPFVLETIRQIVNWLITGSGVIIGLTAKGQSVTTLGKASALALVICIVLGFIHISVFAGGVHSEPSADVARVGRINFLYANILLNLMFIFFLFGIVGLTVGLS
jgi:hypothetical protein